MPGGGAETVARVPAGAVRPRVLPVALLLGSTLIAATGGAALLLWSGSLPIVMAVHGALMMVAWGALLPVGGLVARWFKVTPGQDYPAIVDNRLWWNLHRILQYGGTAVATVGLGVILSETHGRFDTAHGRCGLLVMAVAWLQVASPLMRGSMGGPTDPRACPEDRATWRGDHYDMTPRRRLFEAWHKPAGWSLIALGSVNLLLGADLAAAPDWLFALIGATQASFVLAALDCSLRGRWVDTHAALWGPGQRPMPPGGDGCAGRQQRPPP